MLRRAGWATLTLAGMFAVVPPSLPAFPAAAAATPPAPGSEGPAGPPARQPDGRVASPPRVTFPQISQGCPAAPYGPNYYAGGGGKTVALTFDDGPGASTGKIMSILGKYGVQATFFDLGENEAARPSVVTQQASTGFALGNHTWDHADLTTLPGAGQAAEMDQATAEQKSIVGFPPCLFRPPYGSYNSTTLNLAQQRHMKVWLWSVDTEDWKANGSSSQYWVDRIIRLAETEGAPLTHPVVLMHNQPAGNPATVLALPTIIKFFRSHGYTFVSLLGHVELGYLVTLAGGGVHNFGAPWYGSVAGQLPTGVSAAGVAGDPLTGGYWVLKSNGGVANFNAPWYGSLAGALKPGETVTGIAGSPGGGYYVLTSGGGVHNFGAPWYGSAAGQLPAGVSAAGIAADPLTGGYWVLKSNGGVANFNAPWYGSLAGSIPAGQTVTGIAGSSGGGYYVLTSGGGVHNFGVPWYGSAAGQLPAGVSAAGIAADLASEGYWVLKSNGGVANFNAPWYGSLAGALKPGETVTGITG
jgi:peptidoglycan-N-acetylglucosamine deacetylase